MTEHHPPSRQTPHEQQQKRRRGRVGLNAINTERLVSRGLTLTGSLRTLLVVLLWWAFQHQAPTQPALAGMSRITTEAQLQHSGPNKRVTYDTALDQQAGTVLRPDPAAGTKLDHNSGASVVLLATSESSPALQPWSTPMLDIGAGLLIAVMTAPVGVSGAVFLLPVQLSVLGVPSPAVTPTNLLFNLVAAPGALLRYRKRGQLGGSLTRLLVIGSLPGVVIGAVIRVFAVPGPDVFRLTVAILLLPLGVWLCMQTMRPHPLARRRAPSGRVLTALALAVGVIGGIYGVGGGSILGPILVSRGLPVATVASATLTSTFLTSIVGAGTYSLLALMSTGDIAPNWTLGLACGLGGLLGGYLGAHLQPRMPDTALRLLLGGLAIALAIVYAVQTLT
jgi:uncharacterized membrane protein YfcA